MKEYISKFNKETAPSGHKGTILAGDILPGGMKSPFGHAWGYLEGESMMEAHSHPTDEVYLIVSGKGFCSIDSNRFAVVPGDVITIPPNSMHTMECEDGQTFLWAAFWWDHIE